MILGADELRTLTGHRRSDAQRRALDAMGIPYTVRPNGRTAAKRQGLNAQALLGHTTPAHTERYLRDRESPEVDGPSLQKRVRRP